MFASVCFASTAAAGVLLKTHVVPCGFAGTQVCGVLHVTPSHRQVI
jgi:hypothetical protein